MAGLAIQIISSVRDSLKNGEIDATRAKHRLIGQLNAAGMVGIAGIIDDFYVPHSQDDRPIFFKEQLTKLMLALTEAQQ